MSAGRVAGSAMGMGLEARADMAGAAGEVGEGREPDCVEVRYGGVITFSKESERVCVKGGRKGHQHIWRSTMRKRDGGDALSQHPQSSRNEKHSFP